MGVVTVAVLYRFVAAFYRDRFLGVLAAGFLAVSYWHLHFSRYAIRAVFAPLWAIGAVWAWWVAVGPPGCERDRPATRSRRATAP